MPTSRTSPKDMLRLQQSIVEVRGLLLPVAKVAPALMAQPRPVPATGWRMDHLETEAAQAQSLQLGQEQAAMASAS